MCCLGRKSDDLGQEITAVVSEEINNSHCLRINKKELLAGDRRNQRLSGKN